MAQKTEKRAKEILYLLLHQGKTSVEQLAEHFQTSSTSVRRDLARLERQSLVHRTRGGAMLAGQTYEPFRFDATFTERENRFQHEKQLIGMKAASLIGDGETIGLTAGTTTTEVARALRGRKGLRVLTNAVNIGLELSASEGPQTTLTGGCMIWPGAFSLTGPTALETIEGFVLDAGNEAFGAFRQQRRRSFYERRMTWPFRRARETQPPFAVATRPRLA